MQYGYNTSQTNGLSATGRQKFFAVIIDNKIMSKVKLLATWTFYKSKKFTS